LDLQRPLRAYVQPEIVTQTRSSQPGRHQALLEAAEQLGQFGSWEWIPAESDLLWSDNLFRIFGLEPGEITPTPEYVFERTHPDDRERVARLVAELGESGHLPDLDYRIVGPDGVRHLLATLTVADWRGGVAHRLIGWVQDLTDRRRAEREIEAHLAVTDALTGWESLDADAARLLGRLAGAMDYVAGVFWIPRGDALMAQEVWQEALVELPEFEALTRSARLTRGSGLPGRAWERQEPVSVTRVGETFHTARDEAAAREGLRGGVAIPAIQGEEVLAIIELASREEAELTQRLMRTLTGIGHELGQFFGRRRGELEAPLLTPRQLEVLQLAAAGLPVRESAERLFVSPATVKTHLENIYTKLGVSDKASAVAKGLRMGLIE
jgi:DNA-binding NarL/FixJ family response regulator